MPEPTSTSPDEIRALIARHRDWYHQIELSPGVFTPGPHASPIALAAMDALGLPKDLKGMRVLDVGCRDGFFGFEMEKRGATVTGIDYAAPDMTGFSIAAGILGSPMEYLVANVYDLGPERFGTFDLVLFLGVLYHLRNPLLALDKVRSVARPGALVFVETEVVAGPGVGEMDTPLWQFYPRASLGGDHTNKWAPNLLGLVRGLEECQIAVEETALSGRRALVRGRAVVEDALEYYRRLDSGTGLFDHGR